MLQFMGSQRVRHDWATELNCLTVTAAKSLQSCPTLCDPIDGSPPGSTAPGILQARTLEWGAISFSNAWKWKMKVKSLSRVRLLVTPWTAAYQAPLSMGFFQARVLEWGAIIFSGTDWLKEHKTAYTKTPLPFGFHGFTEWVNSLSRVRVFATPVDCSPPSCSVHGILQARILEWVAISFSRGSSRPRDRT